MLSDPDMLATSYHWLRAVFLGIRAVFLGIRAVFLGITV
jgi:hypothetical protein